MALKRAPFVAETFAFSLFFAFFIVSSIDNFNKKNNLPLDCDLDEVLLLAVPKKDGWRGLADDPRVMGVVVSR